MAVTIHDMCARDPDESPWLRRMIWGLALLLMVGGGAFAAYRLGAFGFLWGEQNLSNAKLKNIAVDADFVQVPPWLSRSLVDDQILAAEMGRFVAVRIPGAKPGVPPIENGRRLQDPQDKGVLRDLATFLEMGRLTDLGTVVENDQSQRFKAWIKSIRSIQRQTIRRQVAGQVQITEMIIIDAVFREPMAFIVQGDSYYLVENITTINGQKQAVRLPGVYTVRERKTMADLPCVSGVDSPTPEPGQAFASADAMAGLELAAILAKQPYIRQIEAIDVSNFNGRSDSNPRKPFMTLDTIFPVTRGSGEPTHIGWGRPVGQEGYFEIGTAAKLNYLTKIFMKYNRIDAGCPYVDVQFDQPTIPMANNPPRSDALDAVPSSHRG